MVDLHRKSGYSEIPMRRLILSISLPLALAAACSKSEPPAAEKPTPPPTETKEEPKPAAPEPLPVRTTGELPRGFPYELMEGDRIHAASSFASDGVQHYEVGLESAPEPERVADYWESQLESKGVKVVRQRVEEPGLMRIVLQGEDAAGVYSRVSVLQNTTEGDEDEKAPSQVTVYVGRR